MINLESKVSGRYRLSVVKPDGKVKETGWFDNLITNGGLNAMYSSDYTGICAVGTSSTAPAFTDTQLGGLLASTNSKTTARDKQLVNSPFYSSSIFTYTFSQGAVVGNVAEVGVGASTTNLFSRALVLDGAGNPTTITILSDEILKVEYELRLQIPEADTTGTFAIGGTTYTWTARAADIDNASFWVAGGEMNLDTFFYGKPNAFDGTIGAITGEPSGALSEADNASNAGYSADSHTATFSATWGISRANFAGGIGACLFLGNLRPIYQIGFSPKIPKTSSDQFTLTISHSWGRA